jgi:hypothetical protein
MIMTEEEKLAERERIKALPAYVLLRRQPGANSYEGYIEHSFSMDWSPDYVRVWWSGTAYSFLGTHQIDGKATAEKDRDEYARRYPDTEFVVFDLHSEECPIEIDWDVWADAMIAGRKFASRNPKFTIKENTSVPVLA